MRKQTIVLALCLFLVGCEEERYKVTGTRELVVKKVDIVTGKGIGSDSCKVVFGLSDRLSVTFFIRSGEGDLFGNSASLAECKALHPGDHKKIPQLGTGAQMRYAWNTEDLEWSFGEVLHN